MYRYLQYSRYKFEPLWIYVHSILNVFNLFALCSIKADSVTIKKLQDLFFAFLLQIEEESIWKKYIFINNAC